MVTPSLEPMSNDFFTSPPKKKEGGDSRYSGGMGSMGQLYWAQLRDLVDPGCEYLFDTQYADIHIYIYNTYMVYDHQ